MISEIQLDTRFQAEKQTTPGESYPLWVYENERAVAPIGDAQDQELMAEYQFRRQTDLDIDAPGNVIESSTEMLGTFSFLIIVQLHN